MYSPLVVDTTIIDRDVCLYLHSKKMELKVTRPEGEELKQAAGFQFKVLVSMNLSDGIVPPSFIGVHIAFQLISNTTSRKLRCDHKIPL